uniref:Uncharacterized protein n=1 Tax=Tetradesmus obliquus TaxID=3088 RepID=A0A383W155_TETOB
MNQHVVKETLKGLLHAPVPACSCAKGLAVGAVQAWDALQELASMCGVSMGSKMRAAPTQETLSAHPAAAGHQTLTAGAAGTSVPDQAAAAPAAARIGPPELLNEADGLAAQQHAVYMRNIMLRAGL